MRTKTLLLSAALSAVGIVAASAQVYSVNVVGYTTITAPVGFSIIANQLNTTNNTVANLIPSPPIGSAVYKFNNGTGSYAINNYFGFWTDTAMTLSPGEGAFFFNGGGSPVSLTFVGEVVQGSTTNNLGAGFNLVSSVVPQSAPVSTSLGLPIAVGDAVYLFRSGSYVIDNYFGFWSPAEPSPNVGEGFFVFKQAAGSWTRTFTVQ